MAKYEVLAKQFCDALRALDGAHIDNLENYLSYHFPEWMEKYAGYPEGLISEMREFSGMEL